MALPAFVSSLDAIDEALREHYKPSEKGSGFILNAEPAGGFGIANVAALQGAADKEREYRQKAEAKLRPYGFTWDNGEEDYTGGLAGSEVQAKIAKLAELEKAGGDATANAQAQIAAREAELSSEHTTQLEAASRVQKNLEEQLEKALVGSQITGGIAAAGVVPARLKLVKDYVSQRIRMVKDSNGDYSSRVVGEDGKVRYSEHPERNAAPMTADELFQEMRTDPAFDGFFQGTQKSGSGLDSDGATPRSQNGHRSVSVGDAKGMGRSLEDIASNKVFVADA